MSKRSVCLAMVLTALCVLDAAGQVPSYGFSRNRGGDESATDRSLPANNPWVVAGAQVGYKFSGNSDFADGLLASSRIGLQTLRFPGQSARVGLPLIGNISRLSPGLGTDSVGSIADRLTNTAEGINVGLYPYYESIDRSGGGPVQVTFYGSTVWKLNAAKDRNDSSTVYLNQGRFTMGMGVDLYIAENNTMPLSLSIEPVLTMVNADAFERVTGRRENRLYSVELTGVMPIGNNMGLLAQLGAPDEGKTLFRVGVIYVASPANGDDDDEDDDDKKRPGTETHGATIQGTVKGANDAALAGRTVEAALYSGSTPQGDRCTDGTLVVEQIDAEGPTDAEGNFLMEVEALAPDANCIVFKITEGGQTRQVAQALTVPALTGNAYSIGPITVTLP